MRVLKPLSQTVIVLFCLWHMLAVFLYNIPFTETTKAIGKHNIPFAEHIGPLVAEYAPALCTGTACLPTTIQDVREKWVSPYLWITSQWQQWNLFSPDPLRRVVVFVIEQHDPYYKRWEPIYTLTPDTIEWYRVPTYFKAINTIHDANKWPFRVRFLRRYCELFNLPSATELRLHAHYYVLPFLREKESVEYWRNYEPQWESVIDVQANCLPLHT